MCSIKPQVVNSVEDAKLLPICTTLYDTIRVIYFPKFFFQEASDLFGCDLPVEGAGCGSFAWRDGPLLQALRNGHWILLDEVSPYCTATSPF